MEYHWCCAANSSLSWNLSQAPAICTVPSALLSAAPYALQAHWIRNQATTPLSPISKRQAELLQRSRFQLVTSFDGPIASGCAVATRGCSRHPPLALHQHHSPSTFRAGDSQASPTSSVPETPVPQSSETFAGLAARLRRTRALI